MEMKNIFKFVLVALIVCPGFTYSQSVNARFSTSFYTWKRYLSETKSQNHFRIYQTAQLTLGQMANNKLSFHFNGLASQDIARDADQDPIPRVYSAYFQWHERKGILRKVRVGRQRIYSGVVYGSIDGVDVSLRAGKKFTFGGFVGFLVPVVNEVAITTWDDAHAFGFRAGAKNLFGTKVLLSFIKRDRRPVAYSAPGRYTQKIIRTESREQTLAGLDLYRSLTKWVSAYGRLDFDVEQRHVRKGQVELKFKATDRLDVAAEFLHRAPFIDANSIFSVFNQKNTQDYGFRANYRINQTWFVNGNFGFINYDGDETVRFSLGVRNKYGSFGYNFRRGYGGENNGVYAAANYPLTDKLGLTASTGFARYGLFNENSDNSTSLTGSLGVNYRPGKHFSLDIIGQGARNKFFNNDFRIFAKANYWAFKIH